MLCACWKPQRSGKPTSGIKWVHDTTIQLYTTSYGTFSLGICTKQLYLCFFEGKTTVPTPPWGTRRWTMVGMTGWFVDLNWDVRWCNHRQWFLIWIYQTMNLAFSTIWFQHRLNNDISNVSYVQMMFFPSPFRWSRNGLVRLWMHFGVLRTNVRGVRLLVRWTKHGQRFWVLGSDMYIEGLGEWWIINDLVSSWEAIFCWAWWHEEICLEEFYVSYVLWSVVHLVGIARKWVCLVWFVIST